MKYAIIRQPLGVEDLLLGIGTVEQTRGNQVITVTKVNAANIPYDENMTIYEKFADFVATLTDVNSLQFTLDASVLLGIGELTWNASEETLDLGLNSDVTLQIGQELLVRGKNTTGSIIPNGRVLMTTGAVGNSGVITVGLHDGTQTNGYKIAGIATQDIGVNEVGFSTLRGKIRGINTTGTPYGETWSDGDRLWVSPSGNGALTNIEPTITQLNMFVGIVVSASVNGTIQVRTNGIDENHFVEYVGTIEEFEGALI